MKLSTYNIVFAICICLLPGVLHARAIKHKVTPRVIDRDVEQRDIFSETVTIENFASHKITVFPSVNVVSVDEGGDVIDFTPPAMSNNKVTVTSWIEITRAGIELMPGEVRDIPLTVKIHPHAEPGVYHAFVGFGWGHNRPIAEQQVQKGIAPGVVVTLSLQENTAEFLKLNNFIVDRFVTNAENNAITYTLRNPSDSEVVPRGEIILSNRRGEEVGSVAINPEGTPLGAGAVTEFTAHMPTKGLLGRYKAFLSVDYGSNQLASLYDTAFFYVLPWRQLLLLFGILSFIVILITIIIHRKYGQREDDDGDDADRLPLYVRDAASAEKDHDINLRST